MLIGLLFLLVFTQPAVAAEGELVRIDGSGTWGSTQPHGPANATWLVADGEVVSFHIVAESGTRASCSAGNGTLSRGDGAGHTGVCGGDRTGEATTLFFQARDDQGENTTLFSGRFQGETQSPVGAAASSQALFPLLALSMIGTALAIGTGVVLGLLFVRERRLTGHLARRLWEKSRGKSASKRPESLGEERVKRILVRSKN